MTGSNGQKKSDTPSPIPHWYTPDSDVLEIRDGTGALVRDATDTEYLDFLSQLYCVNVGHDNQAIIDAIEEQLNRIPYVSSAKGSTPRNELSGRLQQIAPGDLSSIFFAISGSEANEVAIQMAREFQDAPKVLTRWRSYHGSTYGAAGLTGDPETRASVERYAATTGVVKFQPPLPHRSTFDAKTPDELRKQAIDHLEFVIQNEGPDSIAALLTEPIGGTSGAYPTPPGYLKDVRDLCDRYDILLISDEVITGFGRCGDWFGVQTEDVEPDILTFAKGVTSAYVPLAGVITDTTIGEHFRAEGLPVGQTFAGHPVGCAAGVATLDEYEDGLLDRVRSLSPILERELLRLESNHDVVGNVHGRGFLWSVEFTDPESGEPFLHPWAESGENPIVEVREKARANGVLFGSGRPDIQILVAPPYCVDESQLLEGIDVLDGAVTSVFG